MFPVVDGFAYGAEAKNIKTQVGRETGLAVPRFVSLKAKKVNLRVGPGRKYKILWQYKRQHLPVEVIQEFDKWRRIRDSDGDTGWVLHSLLSSKRAAIIAPWEQAKKKQQNTLNMNQNADDGQKKPVFFEVKNAGVQSAKTIAHVQAGLMVNLLSCAKKWCAVEAKGTDFWIEKKLLWGVYPEEILEE